MAYLLALDQGTSSSRSIVFDEHGHVVAMAQREFRQIYPQPGWVEHDPLEIWQSQLATAREALAQACGHRVQFVDEDRALGLELGAQLGEVVDLTGVDEHQLGAGVVGTNAAQMAVGTGAQSRHHIHFVTAC